MVELPVMLEPIRGLVCKRLLVRPGFIVDPPDCLGIKHIDITEEKPHSRPLDRLNN